MVAEREPGRQGGMKFRAIWDRKSKERINGGRMAGWRKERCRSRHAGGRYESQDKGFHTAIEADFEERESAGWNDKNLIWTYLCSLYQAL